MMFKLCILALLGLVLTMAAAEEVQDSHQVDREGRQLYGGFGYSPYGGGIYGGIGGYGGYGGYRGGWGGGWGGWGYPYGYGGYGYRPWGYGGWGGWGRRHHGWGGYGWGK